MSEICGIYQLDKIEQRKTEDDQGEKLIKHILIMKQKGKSMGDDTVKQVLFMMKLWHNNKNVFIHFNLFERK